MSNERERARGPLTDQLLGDRYRLGTILGQGGMGVVYTATQVSLDRAVAIKVLQPGLAQHVDAIARFRAEAERAGRLAHPHIVQILDFGREVDGSAWIAMELLAGQSLAARIAAGPLSEAEVVRVALETLSALEAAHAASLVHRDLKPDNIFLATVSGIGASVKVLDFGIAKLLDGDHANRLTATGTLVGTPLYMSPEQARGHELDARSDLYSLGALLYETLTLAPPFTGGTYSALLLALMTDTPKPIAELRPDVTPALAAVIERAMSRSAGDRFANASEMAAALRAIAPSASVPTLRGAKDLAIAMAATAATPEPLAMAETSPAVSLSPSSAPLAPAAPAPVAAPATRPTPAPETEPDVPRTQARSDDGTGSSRTIVAAIGGALLTLAIVGIGSRFLPGDEPETVAPTTEPSHTGTVTTASSAGSTSLDTPIAPATTAAGTTGTTTSVAVMQPMEPPSTEVAPSAAVPAEVAPTEPEPPPEPEPPATSGRTRPVDPEIAAAHARARRGYTPRVSYSGSHFLGMVSSSDVSGPINAAGGWAECWPREVPPPWENMGRDFTITIAGDGQVLDVSPTAGSTDPPAFARCAAARLRTIHFPSPRDGAQVQIRVSFHVE